MEEEGQEGNWNGTGDKLEKHESSMAQFFKSFQFFVASTTEIFCV